MSNKRKRLRDVDPHADREARIYDHPLPSRELILDTLETEGVPLTDERLAEMLDIAPHELDGFAKRLAAMERDGQVMRNRRGAVCLVAKLDLIKGRVVGHKDGFGFLVPDDGSPDLFLNPKEMHKVLHGDRVMVREVGVDRRGRREGAIVEVLEPFDKLLDQFFRRTAYRKFLITNTGLREMDHICADSIYRDVYLSVAPVFA